MKTFLWQLTHEGRELLSDCACLQSGHEMQMDSSTGPWTTGTYTGTLQSES